jgi:hypothetical protein
VKNFGRTSALLVGCVLVSLGFTACSISESVAYHVDDGLIDTAFCDEFTASSLEIEFGNYPPPLMGGLYRIALRKYSGPATHFGGGVPISEGLVGWQIADDSDPVPADWDRIDFTFNHADGSFAGASLLSGQDVKSDTWAWTDGFNTGEPQCDLVVDGRPFETPAR